MQKTQETQVWSLGWEDPLEKEMATHSSTLAWKIPWMEEPGRLQSMGSQRVGTWLSDFTFTFTLVSGIHLFVCQYLLFLLNILILFTTYYKIWVMHVHNLKVQRVFENMKYIIPAFLSLLSPTDSFSQMSFNGQKPDSLFPSKDRYFVSHLNDQPFVSKARNYYQFCMYSSKRHFKSESVSCSVVSDSLRPHGP